MTNISSIKHAKNTLFSSRFLGIRGVTRYDHSVLPAVASLVLSARSLTLCVTAISSSFTTISYKRSGKPISARTMVLCQICSSLLTLDALGPTSPDLIPQHSSIRDFLRSVQEKCSLCWRGYRHLRPYVKLKLEQLAAQETLQLSEKATENESERQQKSSIVRNRKEEARSVDHKVSHIWVRWDQASSGSNGLRRLSMRLIIDGVHDNAPAFCDALFLIPTAGKYSFILPCPPPHTNNG